MTPKKWLQAVGAATMLSAIYNGRSAVKLHFDPKLFLAGALMFAFSFLTWKRKGDGNN
jgi:hypothetical protein